MRAEELPAKEVTRAQPPRKKKPRKNSKGQTEAADASLDGDAGPDDEAPLDRDQFKQRPQDSFDAFGRVDHLQGAGARFRGLWERIPDEFAHVVTLGTLGAPRIV